MDRVEFLVVFSLDLLAGFGGFCVICSINGNETALSLFLGILRSTLLRHSRVM